MTFGVAGMYAFLGLALVMNASAYWFSDRIALFSTHPPLEEKIRRLQAMAGGMHA